jgi:hypothetical protein
LNDARDLDSLAESPGKDGDTMQDSAYGESYDYYNADAPMSNRAHILGAPLERRALMSLEKQLELEPPESKHDLQVPNCHFFLLIQHHISKNYFFLYIYIITTIYYVY